MTTERLQKGRGKQVLLLLTITVWGVVVLLSAIAVQSNILSYAFAWSLLIVVTVLTLPIFIAQSIQKMQSKYQKQLLKAYELPLSFEVSRSYVHVQHVIMLITSGIFSFLAFIFIFFREVLVLRVEVTVLVVTLTIFFITLYIESIYYRMLYDTVVSFYKTHVSYIKTSVLKVYQLDARKKYIYPKYADDYGTAFQKYNGLLFSLYFLIILVFGVLLYICLPKEGLSFSVSLLLIFSCLLIMDMSMSGARYIAYATFIVPCIKQLKHERERVEDVLKNTEHYVRNKTEEERKEEERLMANRVVSQATSSILYNREDVTSYNLSDVERQYTQSRIQEQEDNTDDLREEEIASGISHVEKQEHE